MHSIFIKSGRLNDKRDHVLPLEPESNLKCFLQLLRNSKESDDHIKKPSCD